MNRKHTAAADPGVMSCSKLSVKNDTQIDLALVRAAREDPSHQGNHRYLDLLSQKM